MNQKHQDICPICTEPFRKEEVIIEYMSWDTASVGGKRLGHLDCVLHLSELEKRKHPPKGRK